MEVVPPNTNSSPAHGYDRNMSFPRLGLEEAMNGTGSILAPLLEKLPSFLERLPSFTKGSEEPMNTQVFEKLPSFVRQVLEDPSSAGCQGLEKPPSFKKLFSFSDSAFDDTFLNSILNDAVGKDYLMNANVAAAAAPVPMPNPISDKQAEDAGLEAFAVKWTSQATSATTSGTDARGDTERSALDAMSGSCSDDYSSCDDADRQKSDDDDEDGYRRKKNENVDPAERRLRIKARRAESARRARARKGEYLRNLEAENANLRTQLKKIRMMFRQSVETAIAVAQMSAAQAQQQVQQQAAAAALASSMPNIFSASANLSNLVPNLASQFSNPQRINSAPIMSVASQMGSASAQTQQAQLDLRSLLSI